MEDPPAATLFQLRVELSEGRYALLDGLLVLEGFLRVPLQVFKELLENVGCIESPASKAGKLVADIEAEFVRIVDDLNDCLKKWETTAMAQRSGNGQEVIAIINKIRTALEALISLCIGSETLRAHLAQLKEVKRHLALTAEEYLEKMRSLVQLLNDLSSAPSLEKESEEKLYSSEAVADHRRRQVEAAASESSEPEDMASLETGGEASVEVHVSCEVIDHGKTYVKVPVFYGTDRKHKDGSQGREEYMHARETWSADGDFDLHYGVAYVSIPETHRQGQLEDPPLKRSFLRHWLASPTAHVLVLDVKKFRDFADFEASLKATLNSEEPEGCQTGTDKGLSRSILLFIHGYNTEFDEAMRRAAQLKYDLAFPGPVVAYCWPSAGSFSSYSVDEATIDWTSSHFQGFLKRLLELQSSQEQREGQEAEVHVLAHSMGNRLVMQAMEAAALIHREDSLEAPAWKKSFGKVVAAAPDVDAAYFHHVAKRFSRRSGLPRLEAERGARLTLYTSKSDLPVSTSEWIHGYPRAGRCAKDFLVVAPMYYDTVVAPTAGLKDYFDFNFGYGHSGFAKARELIADLTAVISMRTHKPDKSGASPILGRESVEFVNNVNKCPFSGWYWQLARQSNSEDI